MDEEGNRAQHKVMLALLLVAPAIPLPKGTEPTALAARQTGCATYSSVSGDATDTAWCAAACGANACPQDKCKCADGDTTPQAPAPVTTDATVPGAVPAEVPAAVPAAVPGAVPGVAAPGEDEANDSIPGWTPTPALTSYFASFMMQTPLRPPSMTGLVAQR